MAEYVIVVDEGDREVGHEEKLLAHIHASLHRAVSVFVFDGAGRMLLQRRSDSKYHSPGLWSNACCGHPRPGESTGDAARRRLQEEMGFSCDLSQACTVRYRLDVGDGLAEHEYDHVFVGSFNGQPQPDPKEVREWSWIGRADLVHALKETPAIFTPWLRVILNHLEESLPSIAALDAAW